MLNSDELRETRVHQASLRDKDRYGADNIAKEMKNKAFDRLIK